MAIVEVRPIDSVKWHGKQGKESFGQPNTIEVLYDSKTGRYATGLTPEEAEELGKLTGQDLSDAFDPLKPHPYWSSMAARIKLPNNTRIFDTSNPMDRIKVANLKASKYVANSYAEWQSGKFPEATHVIFSEEEEMMVKASKVSRKRAATKLAMEMSKDEKINVVMIIKGKSFRGRSENFVDVAIDEIMEVPEHLDLFLTYAQMDKAEVYIRAAVLESLHRNILTKEGAAVYYMGDKIGNDIEDAVNYFKDPNNQALKAAILEKLNK